MKHKRNKYLLLITYYSLLLALLASCATPASAPPVFPTFILVTQDPNASPTLTPFQPSGGIDTPLPTFTLSPIPSDTPTMTATATLTASPTPIPPTPTVGSVPTAVPPPTASPPSRTNYILYATLDFDAHTLEADETIRYYNTTGVPLSDIVLSVQPNRYGGAFSLLAVYQDNAALTTYSLNDQRLTLNLPQPLQPGAATTLGIKFKINIPAKANEGLFGYDFNQIDLVDWYPFVVPRERSTAGYCMTRCRLANILFTIHPILNLT